MKKLPTPITLRVDQATFDQIKQFAAQCFAVGMSESEVMELIKQGLPKEAYTSKGD